MTEPTKPKKPRRGKGEGTIAKVKDRELWCARITVGRSPVGKRIRKTVYGKTRKEVADKLARLQTQRLDGNLTASRSVTVAQFVARYLEDVARVTLKPRSYLDYEQKLRKHVTPHVGGIRLEKLSPPDVQSILGAMERAGKSPTTRQRVRSILRRALQVALKWGLVVRNVCDVVDAPTVRRKEANSLPADSVVQLLEAVRGDRLEALWIVAVTSGCRQGELIGLEWGDVDFKAGTVSIQRSVYRVKNQPIVGEPKSKRGRRLIRLPDFAMDALADHRRKLVSEGLAGSPLVFPAPDGSYIKADWLYRVAFRDALAAAELPSMKFHDLRHTAASLLLSEGVHPKVVQERLGHSTVQITLDTYSHVVPSLQQDAAERMNRLLKRDLG